MRGDLNPMSISLVTSAGAAVDITTADTVEFRWVKPDGTLYSTAPTIVTAATGSIRIDWASDDTDQVGPHLGEVIVTTDGVPTTYPNDGSKIIWWVNPQVGDLI